jgi:bifunctional non-homologous end joining protein LigD
MKPVLGITISHPDREIWPGISKLDLARYYEAAGERFLPHVKGRPLSLVRCPGGIGKPCFYQRHLKGTSDYFSFDSMRQVIAAVQNGTVEFHTWGARAPDLQRPDRITLDFDPGPGVTWKSLVEATHMTKALLDDLGLDSFLKSTGGKGLHIVVPIEPKRGWDEVKDFSRRLAYFLVRAAPRLFLATMSKNKRTKKIFVDYLRNAETASAVAAYSARARPGATVSTPLAWDELGKEDLRARFTVKTVLKRTKEEDPWRAYWKKRQTLEPKMFKALSAPGDA